MNRNELREKWRATLYNDNQRERFDALVVRFDDSDRRDQGRIGALAGALAIGGGPMSPLHAAYLNYCLDVCRRIAR